MGCFHSRSVLDIYGHEQRLETDGMNEAASPHAALSRWNKQKQQDITDEIRTQLGLGRISEAAPNETQQVSAPGGSWPGSGYFSRDRKPLKPAIKREGGFSRSSANTDIAPSELSNQAMPAGRISLFRESGPSASSSSSVRLLVNGTRLSPGEWPELGPCPMIDAEVKTCRMRRVTHDQESGSALKSNDSHGGSLLTQGLMRPSLPATMTRRLPVLGRISISKRTIEDLSDLEYI